MKLVLDIDRTDARLGDWIRAALAGLHPSTNAACELADALAAAVRTPAGRLSAAAVVTAYAANGCSVKATAKALGIARSTVRARLAEATAAALALEARVGGPANDNWCAQNAARTG